MNIADTFISPAPLLEIPKSVWHQIMGYTLVCPAEVSGFGYITRVENAFRLSKVFIIDQMASSRGVITNDEALGRHVTQMVLDGVPTEQLRFQWHSHMWGTAYCSHRDVATIREFGEDDANRPDWTVSMVVNKIGEAYTRLDLFQHPPFQVTVPLHWRPEPTTVPPKVIEMCREEVAAKVRTPRGQPPRQVSDERIAIIQESNRARN